MRKFTLLIAALAVSIGAASAMACDHDKASSASASKSSSGSCCSSSSNASAQLTSSGKGECSGEKSAMSGSCSAHKNAGAMSTACKDGDVADAVFQVASIHGNCCVDGVASALSTVKGVQYVNVDVKAKKAYVCTRGAKIDQKAALKNLKEAGFANAVYLGADKKYSMKEASKASAKTNSTSKV